MAAASLERGTVPDRGAFSSGRSFPDGLVPGIRRRDEIIMRVRANHVGIEVDVHGPDSGEPLLLVMGLGMQLIGWPDELVAALVARGFRVIRFDNRDAGLSDGFDQLGVIDMRWAVVRYFLRMKVGSPYSLADMAEDTRGVLDALGVGTAHVCGASMGGMIAQHLAAGHPERVRSLTLLMSSSGARGLPGPSLRILHAMFFSRRARDPASAMERRLRLKALIGSPGYPLDPVRARARLEASIARAWRPAGAARQAAAIVADGDRTPLLGRIQAPTQVIHGSADRLVPPAAGRSLAAGIPGARAEFIDGLGHDFPVPLLGRFADLIAGNARRTAQRMP
ncbi:MAG: hypothetical protein RIS76_3336 [Verrucomicrobiota bacterium]